MATSAEQKIQSFNDRVNKFYDEELGQVDTKGSRNPQLAAEYAEAIFAHCKAVEDQTLANPDYMS